MKHDGSVMRRLEIADKAFLDGRASQGRTALRTIIIIL